MKKLILSICLLSSLAFAGIFEDSFKIYSQDADSLFMNAMSAISSNNNFKIVEIQSKNGYILFLYGSKYYLLTLTKRYQNQTEIKVLPQNSDYSDGSTVANAIFLAIDNEIKTRPVGALK